MIIAAIDTNILLYAADRSGDAEKHRRAADLLDRAAAFRRVILPLQALTEFYAVAVRKLGAPAADAAAFVAACSDAFPVHAPAIADLADAMRVHQGHGIAFWDAMIWSVARRAGAKLLLSEDLQDGRELEGVRFANPFASANAGLVDGLFG